MRRPVLKRRLMAAAGVLAALALVWVSGFAWFVHRANLAGNAPARADGIVALTGGAGRVEMALRLLVEGRARIALLSGIGGGAELAQFAHRAGLDPAPLDGRVTLGRNATSTRGNATETAAWAREHEIRSLIVVTAGYHMPRALTELGHAMPDVALYPVPVMPPAMQGPGGVRDAATLRLLAEEYTKWLASTLGLSALGPPHEAVPGRTAHASAKS
ncbi:MAG: YdcF family protein [Alphaproteobacteria bacterium]|nr:YdcF family protein [Alphaproteobacteria bacterium]